MLKKGEIFLSLFIAFFAIGSWIDLNGVWVELPLLVNKLPEGWNLPTYIVILVQFANIAPILYLTLSRKLKCINNERYTIYAILILGSVCCGLLSEFWSKTIEFYIDGKWKESSVVFFILICILSIVDTTSSVTFLPYLTNFPRQYITALYVGEGFSGLIPGIAGLIQGIGAEPMCLNITKVINNTNETTIVPYFSPPRFSVSTFFLLLCGILIFCLLSFSLVDNLSLFKKYQIKKSIKIDVKCLASEENGNTVMHPDVLLPNLYLPKSKKIHYLFLFAICYMNFMTNGVLPSIQNYTLMPYSNKLYHVVVTVSQIINPLACLLTLKKWNIKYSYIIFMIVTASIFSSYLIFLAAMSPNQFLGLSVGPVLAALSWFIVGAIFSFLKTIIAIELQKNGHFWLQLCGISTQLGSALGALVIFILVAVLQVFKTKAVC